MPNRAEIDLSAIGHVEWAKLGNSTTFVIPVLTWESALDGGRAHCVKVIDAHSDLYLLKYCPQRPVCLPRLGVERFQVLQNFSDRSMRLSVSGVDVAGRGLRCAGPFAEERFGARYRRLIRHPILGLTYILLNLRGGYRFWQQKAAAGYMREAEIAVSAFNALEDRHKENPIGDTIGRRVVGWLTLRF